MIGLLSMPFEEEICLELVGYDSVSSRKLDLGPSGID
jgi:hypothetical protein